MKKMLVTLTVQTEIDYDETDDGVYEEELGQLITDLEDMGLCVNIESEENSEDDDDEL